MSLQQMSWRNVQRINRTHDTRFVAVAADHSHVKLGITTAGDVYLLHPDGTIEADPEERTTTATYLATGEPHGLSDEWCTEVTRRRAALQDAD